MCLDFSYLDIPYYSFLLNVLITTFHLNISYQTTLDWIMINALPIKHAVYDCAALNIENCLDQTYCITSHHCDCFMPCTSVFPMPIIKCSRHLGCSLRCSMSGVFLLVLRGMSFNTSTEYDGGVCTNEHTPFSLSAGVFAVTLC